MERRPQSWREMSVAPRAFITIVVLCGLSVLTYTVFHGSSQNPLKFFCYLVIALFASRLKVNLPGITGTMSDGRPQCAQRHRRWYGAQRERNDQYRRVDTHGDEGIACE